MNLIELFKNQLRESGEENVDTVMSALNTVESNIRNATDKEIYAFGEYFISNYDKMTLVRRLTDYCGKEPKVIGTYKFLQSIEMDQKVFNMFKRSFSKKEEFEVKWLKKELKKLVDKYDEILIHKDAVLDTFTLSNYIFITKQENIDVMTTDYIDIFVRNTILAEKCNIISLVNGSNEKFTYEFENGHLLNNKERKY